MKKLCLFVFSAFMTLHLLAQTDFETETFANDTYYGTSVNLPIIREIKGGTKFIITYEGTWTNEMKGAFEYACKIWEENLPTMLPLRVTAKVAKIRSGSGKPVISKSDIKLPYYPYLDRATLKTRAQIKWTALEEYSRGDVIQYTSLFTQDFFNTSDITITYNSDMLSEFSYTLNEVPSDKYDFITLTLREIAKSFGFLCSSSANATSGAVYIDNIEYTHFENLIRNALGTDSTAMYVNATQGSLPISIQSYGTLNLYAPNPWVTGTSLNYFIPDSTKNVTQLLSHEFGKGMIVRDISDKYQLLFSNAMGWDINFYVGNTNELAHNSYSTEDVVEYGGDFVVNERSFEDMMTTQSEIVAIGIEPNYTLNQLNEDNPLLNMFTYCEPYDYSLSMDGSIGFEGWTCSLLKKDGTWDVVLEIPYDMYNLEISTDSFQLHYPASDYARTCDGYLRCRVAKGEYIDGFYGRHFKSTLTYYVLDYLPQEVELDFIGVVSSSTYSARNIVEDDEYMRTIKIGIKNLEGIDNIIVEQHDEWENVPYRYVVDDFKDGYFTAIVDKEFTSTFCIIASNENGAVRSDTLVIEPLEPAEMQIEALVNNDYIEVNTTSLRLRTLNPEQLTMTYQIKNLSEYTTPQVLSGELTNNDKCIDVSSLKSGLYVLQINDVNNNPHTIKFRIR